MSFFGFDATRHNTAAPGFSQTNDPFAGLSGLNNTDDAIEFDDTYDGLGDQLEETGDAFNDDTFGGGIGDNNTAAFRSSGDKVGNDFDFFGQTAKVADAFEEEHARFSLFQPQEAKKSAPPPATQQRFDFFGPSSAKPVRSGYEKYKEPEPEMQVDAALWGVAPKKLAPSSTATASGSQGTAKAAPGSGRKILSLEEVEAAMRAQSKSSGPDAPGLQQPPAYSPASSSQPRPYQQHAPQPSELPRLTPAHYPLPPMEAMGGRGNAGQQPKMGGGHPVSILQRPQIHDLPPPHAVPPPAPHGFSAQPVQILQNPNRLPGFEAGDFLPLVFPDQHGHRRQQSSVSVSLNTITHSSQVAHLSEEDKAAYLELEAKRAKRNHKIFLLSKDNGLMTPQDKNFVTRIQLQQLVTATGNPNDHGTDEALQEDFYYQVFSQIRGSNRQHPSQPLNNFAQTYLFQTGSRFNSRRFLGRDRGGENHMQRMEQQVQRAVEAAKNRPKSKQLVIEGTLGKISFSNAKTPKPLLNIKRAEAGSGSASGGGEPRPGSAHKGSLSQSGGGSSNGVVDHRSILRNIEEVYLTVMELEDHSRKEPPPAIDAEDLDLRQRRAEWTQTKEALCTRLWSGLRVHEPIGASPVHPFIAYLSVAKGKKSIPRVFRHLSEEQCITILTMIVVHLDQLDVVCQAQVDNGDMQPNAALREKIELFSLAVLGPLFSCISKLDLNLVSGVLGLICSLNVGVVAKSRIGASMLTMILSRAEIIKQNGGGTPELWQSWEASYTSFFNRLEPTLAFLFPGTVSSGEDMYVWQLLAALGIGANADQQQRLVLAVKDRVMDTVAVAKTLPVDLSTQRLQNVNLFMRSIGLDVELLQ